jgi:hypothetical protein
MKIITPLIVLLLVFPAVHAIAQYAGSYDYPSYARATPRQGMADMISASGSRNLSNSEAAINMTDARSKQLDNHLKTTDTYFQNRLNNKKYREELNGPRKVTHNAFRKLPPPLSPSEVDPVTGQINWPPLVAQLPFQKDVKTVDDIFATWALNQRQFGSEDASTLRKTVARMLRLVTGFAKQDTASNYEEINALLRALGHAPANQNVS